MCPQFQERCNHSSLSSNLSPHQNTFFIHASSTEGQSMCLQGLANQSVKLVFSLSDWCEARSKLNILIEQYHDLMIRLMIVPEHGLTLPTPMDPLPSLQVV